MWQTLEQRYPISEADRQIGQVLFDEYCRQGHLRRTCLEMLRVSSGAMIDFYARVSRVRKADSPVKHHSNSGWMADADFCFMNVRATGLDGVFGNWTQAAKLLPALRVNAIHVAPFTSYDFACIYAPQSVEMIARQTVDPELETLGFPTEAQLRAFVAAAHLLGMAVGFDLEPHTTQFSKTALMHPEHFRWLKLAENRDALADGLSNEEMVLEVAQGPIFEEVRAIVAAELQARQLESIEHVESDAPERRAAKDSAYFGLIRRVIDLGYWTIPSQVWDCDGIPAFGGYNHERNYTKFFYQNRHGHDRGNEAYHITTPFKFYTNLPLNQPPTPDALPRLDAATLDFFCGIFRKWRDEFDFDFVRYDSVDHIFDSVYHHDSALPASDRPTPFVLQTCVAAVKTGKPYIGNFAERMGNEIHEYQALGYDVMLGNDMCERITKHQIEKSFWIYDQLATLNETRPSRFAIPFAVDTHDTGNPFIWGRSLIELMGFERMRQRHFVSRFISAGLARRPKYEVAGAQDLSFGLYQANVTEANATWIGHQEYNARYHELEDLYERFRPFLRRARLAKRVVTDVSACWVFQDGNEWLVPVLSLEIEHGHPPDAAYFEIRFDECAAGCAGFHVTEYDFAAPAGRDFTMPALHLHGHLRYLTFKLFHIR